MAWDFDSERPIYTQILDEMKRRITIGIYPPGTKIPAVRELAMEACVNPNTMQKALAELENLGLVESRRTMGRFVTENAKRIDSEKDEIAKAQIENFISGMAKLGYTRQEMIAMIENMCQEGEEQE